MSVYHVHLCQHHKHNPSFHRAGWKEVSRGGHDVEPEGLLGQQPTKITGSETSLRSQKLARFFGGLILFGVCISMYVGATGQHWVSSSIALQL